MPTSPRTRQSITADTVGWEFEFQGAGSLAGANGTFFHSDVSIANYRSAPQTLAIGWLAQGADNSNEFVQYFSIPANTTAFLDDFVTSTLHKSGFGAVIVTGVDTFHNDDESALIDGQSRIWTYQPGSAGKVSLGLPAVDINDAAGNDFGSALGLRQDASAHTNVGIVNLDRFDHTFTVTAKGASKTATFIVTVKPFSVSQAGIPAGNYGNLILMIVPDPSTFVWSAYGVSIDNITGDSWVSHVNQPFPSF